MSGDIFTKLLNTPPLTIIVLSIFTITVSIIKLFNLMSLTTKSFVTSEELKLMINNESLEAELLTILSPLVFSAVMVIEGPVPS